MIKDDNEYSKIQRIRHSMAHMLAYAVEELYGKVQLGFGPATENGFYYDFDFEEKSVTKDDLPRIEKKIKELIKKKFSFERKEFSFEEALKKVSDSNQKYKEIHIKRLNEQSINAFSFYETGNFSDLCEGPHIANTEELLNIPFQLDRISGAYWLGSEKNKMLTRIYAVCFLNENDFNEFFEMRKKAEEWDHKKLGKELDLFFIDETIGKGLILWTPNGTVIREEIEKYAKEMEFKYGYKRVATPHIAKKELFLKSGHLPAYEESMFPPMIVKEEGEVKETFYLKPMNCPYHHTIYAAQHASYKELPLRLAEYGTCYRFEQSGELSGLLRVRCMTMNDAHIYAAENQLESEIKSILGMYKEFYKTFNLKNFYFRLSIRGQENKEKFIGDSNLWDKAEKILKDVLVEMEIPYYLGEGEAAFYGPKIDIQFKNLMGREETVSTIQVDFQSSIKFNLSYIDSNGLSKQPVIIHRAPLSTHERFISFLIENYGGAFPLWLAPTQIAIIPVSPVFNDYALNLSKKLFNNFIRVKVDDTDNSLNKKIRTNVTLKIPIILIIGQNEVNNETVTVRRYGQKQQYTEKLDEFLQKIKDEIEKRTIISSISI